MEAGNLQKPNKPKSEDFEMIKCEFIGKIMLDLLFCFNWQTSVSQLRTKYIRFVFQSIIRQEFYFLC